MRTLAAGLAVMIALGTPGKSMAGLVKAKPLRTGQTTTYGAAGETTKGVVPSYVDLGNGVVKDQKTGLFWEKKSDDDSIHDQDAVFSWSSSGSLADGSAFTVFLATLNSPPCFASFCDWRMPTLNEIETLRDVGRENPASPPPFQSDCTLGCSVLTCSCTGFGSSDVDFYWSSTTDQIPSYARRLSFNYGDVSYQFKTEALHVRAVRGGAN